MIYKKMNIYEIEWPSLTKRTAFFIDIKENAYFGEVYKYSKN